MTVLQNNITLIRPDINYLDLITKLISRGSEVFDFETVHFENQVVTRFKHSIDDEFSTFQEEFHYNKRNELTSWKTIVNNKVYVIYDESLFH
ncbi:hypothetical protein ACMGD3_07510 [Lysinibacillus sphaericus]|uniref:hypothetical protein n=1 Tax=Lysinibacillus sphaericus TaxID=1421 RepID=UPI003F78B9E7